MVQRILTPSQTNSYFLFGPRGTGKTTLLKGLSSSVPSLYVDLLDPEEEDLLVRHPLELESRVSALTEGTQWVIVDEIQKAPKLLDLVHKLTESTSVKFVLTGSSGRKLKRGASNLLAGRAFVYHLHPLTCRESGDTFDLQEALLWGTLPKVLQYTSDDDRASFLRAYALTYLKEEIAAEQVVRKLDPFRQFLEVAAQSNGRIVNYTKIADDVGVDAKTVQSYFQILEETLVGTLLPAYHTSVRKRQRMNPKFYLFDPGVKRALDRTLSIGLAEGTYAYGEAFEHFVILEITRLSAYRANDWQFSYLRTNGGVEVDLIIDRPGMPTALVEIKSSTSVSGRDTTALNRLLDDITPGEAFCLSRDPHVKKIERVWCLPWQAGLEKLGL